METAVYTHLQNHSLSDRKVSEPTCLGSNTSMFKKYTRLPPSSKGNQLTILRIKWVWHQACSKIPQKVSRTFCLNDLEKSHVTVWALKMMECFNKVRQTRLSGTAHPEVITVPCGAMWQVACWLRRVRKGHFWITMTTSCSSLSCSLETVCHLLGEFSGMLTEANACEPRSNLQEHLVPFLSVRYMCEVHCEWVWNGCLRTQTWG